MIFDLESYNAEDTYKIISENYYQCLIKNNLESKEGMVRAREDWHISKILPDEEKTEIFWASSLHKNQIFKDLNVSLSNIALSTFPYSEEEAAQKNIKRYEASLLQGVYSRKNDKFLGFSLDRILDRKIFHMMLCLLPEHRHKNIATEMGIANSKYIFCEKDYLSSSMSVPMEGDSIEASPLSLDMVEDKEKLIIKNSFTSSYRGYPITYCTVVTTRDDFNNWINLPNNKEYKEAYFDFEDL